MSFTEDRSLFMPDFGQSVTIGTSTVTAIFQDAYAPGSVGIGMAGAAPQIMLPTTSIPADPVGESVTVGTSSYTVCEHHPDGTGFSVLLLEDA